MLNRGGVGEGEGGSGSFRGEQHTRARRAAEPLATAFKERRLPRRAGVQGSEPGSGPAHRSSRTTHQGTQGPCKGAGCSLFAHTFDCCVVSPLPASPIVISHITPATPQATLPVECSTLHSTIFTILRNFRIGCTYLLPPNTKTVSLLPYPVGYPGEQPRQEHVDEGFFCRRQGRLRPPRARGDDSPRARQPVDGNAYKQKGWTVMACAILAFSAKRASRLPDYLDPQ